MPSFLSQTKIPKWQVIAIYNVPISISKLILSCYLPFGESAVWWPFPLAFPVTAAVGVEACVSSDAEADALI